MPTHEPVRRRRRQARQGAPRSPRPAPRPATPASTERELKLAVPAGSWEALAARMAGPDARHLDLRAIYHDTADRALARARISLRLRREDGQWVQTLKSPGRHALVRLEDNVPLGPALRDAAPPRLELARHQPAAIEAVREGLALQPDDELPALQPVFEVRVRRQVLRVAQGSSVVEVALDAGELLAAGRRSPIRELELELVAGDPLDLLALARRWRDRWGLWIETASKAARGDRLAGGEGHAPAMHAAAPRLPGRPDPGRFAAAVLDACLDQVMDNAAALARGDGSHEHVHQLRVGLRRLRTALRDVPALAGRARPVEPALVRVFRALGEVRDRGQVLGTLQPLVEAAGGPPLRLPPGFHDSPDPGELVRADDFQQALLGLLAVAEAARHGSGKHLRRDLRARLDRLHRQVAADGRRFATLPPARQHRVRKRLKRLRYLGEFAAPLFPARAAHRYLAGLKPAQDALGDFNDEATAQGLYRDLAGDPGAAFAVQWLEERRPRHAKACRAALRRLARATPFWQAD